MAVPLLLEVLYFALPTHVDRTNRPDLICIDNLRIIEGAKEMWALEHNKTNGPVTWEDIHPYLGRGGTNSPLPLCPSGGSYTLHNIEELPTCSISGHALPPTTNIPAAVSHFEHPARSAVDVH